MPEPELSPVLTQRPALDEPMRPRLSETLGVPCAAFDPSAVHHIGVFLGEGVGGEEPVAERCEGAEVFGADAVGGAEEDVVS